MHVFYVETCQIKRVGHFAVAVNPFFADDGRTGMLFPTVVAVCDAARCESAVERCGDGVAQRLFLVVLEAHGGAFGSALYAVEQVGGFKPCVAQVVYAHQALVAHMFEHQHALL